MQSIKKTLIKVLDLFRHQKSYSQDGEDMVLRSFMETLPKGYRGFYVDVGAHHPVRFSNTYYFYRKGWTGINIDATPGSMTLFRWFRRRDTNLELGIGAEKGSLSFYCFDEPALNTLSESVAEERASGGRYKIKKKVEVPVLPLKEVLAMHLPATRKIDFFSVDVEGLDEMVLRSNDWKRFRPTFVLAEDAGFQLSDPERKGLGVYQLLTENGYVLVAKTQRTLVFQDNLA
ncbi:MAG: FkbM family methyltransferase [Saprospiraceae bacterium]|nr:FkbM family methyltransferase [Saprospiraceae bacterium]